MVDSLVKSRWTGCRRLGLRPLELREGEKGARMVERRAVGSAWRVVQRMGRVVVLKRCWVSARERPEEAGEQRMKLAI